MVCLRNICINTLNNGDNDDDDDDDTEESAPSYGLNDLAPNCHTILVVSLYFRKEK